MGGQRTLFMEMQQDLPEGEPRGFRYREQIVGESEEMAGKWGMVNFGLKHDFGRRSVEKAEDMPSFLPADVCSSV